MPLPHFRWKRIFHISVLLCAGLVWIVGCDASIRSFKASDQRVFSIYGVLTPQDTQWIRVEPLAEPTSGGRLAP